MMTPQEWKALTGKQTAGFWAAVESGDPITIRRENRDFIEYVIRCNGKRIGTIEPMSMQRLGDKWAIYGKVTDRKVPLCQFPRLRDATALIRHLEEKALLAKYT